MIEQVVLLLIFKFYIELFSVHCMVLKSINYSRIAHNKGCRNPASYIGIALTIHQAVGVYMHWVIL